MRYLLDTNVFIWWQGESPLQARAENIVFLTQDPRCRAYDVRVL